MSIIYYYNFRVYFVKNASQGDREPQICEWMLGVTIMKTLIPYDLRIWSADVSYQYVVMISKMQHYYLSYLIKTHLIWFGTA